MTTDSLALFRNMPVFGAVDDEALRFVIDRARQHRFERDAFVFRATDAATSMFVLRSGHAAVLREHRGIDHHLAELGPGDCFGEMALIECAPRSASVRTLEPCEVLEIDLDVLHALYEARLEQFVLIQMNLAREVSRRLRFAVDQLFDAKVAASELGGDYRWYLV